MKKENQYLLIAAAGSGTRMSGKTPKQFMVINDKPIIIWSIEAFLPFVNIESIIVVISKKHQEIWDSLIVYFEDLRKIKTVYGGPERFHSVKAALKFVPDNSLVAIHDAARPLVSPETISNCFQLANIKGNAIPVVDIKNSIRLLENGDNRSIYRKTLKSVQTPQVFNSSILKEAYNVSYLESFTDDASVLEHAGHKIYLCNGNEENIKISSISDLKQAEFILGGSGFSSYS